MRKVTGLLVRLGIGLGCLALLAGLLSLARPSPVLASRMLGASLIDEVLASLAGTGVTSTVKRPLVFTTTGDESCRPEIDKLASLEPGLRAAGPGERVEATFRCSWDGRTLDLSVRTEGTSASARASSPDFRSVLPPLIAVVIALAIRNVHISLLVAIWTGALLFRGPGWTLGLGTVIERYLWGTLVDQFNFSILVFTLSLVGMVQIANRAGGGMGLANTVGRLARSSRSAKLAASLLGLLIFFDDYSNTVVVGTTMRPLTDRYRVSREKLSYIVDSTSAPVAGIALISTWIGYEVGLLEQLSDSLGLGITGYSLFLSIVPIRFYCYSALALMLLTSAMNRDFGPMLRAERRAHETGLLTAPGARPLAGSSMTGTEAAAGIRPWWATLVVPVIASLVVTAVGMMLEGGRSGDAAAWASGHGRWNPTYIRLCFEKADGAFVLLVGALSGSWVAGLMATSRPLDATAGTGTSRPTRMRELLLPVPAGILSALVIAMIHQGGSMPLSDGSSTTMVSVEYFTSLIASRDTLILLAIFGALSIAATSILCYRLAVERTRARFHGLSFVDSGKAWLGSLRSMSYALTILVMAWAIRRVCDDLGTSTFIVSTLGSVAKPWLVPALTFVLSSIVSFATGTSWGTMGILIPTLLPFAFHIGGLPTLVLSVGAVLDGAIFGDHASPISDTTVLSSITSSCDHIDHVKTQLPYALVASAVALACGYLPLGLGVTMPLEHLAAAVMLLVVVRLVGRKIAS